MKLKLLLSTLALASQNSNAQIHPSHQVILAVHQNLDEGALSVVEIATP